MVDKKESFEIDIAIPILGEKPFRAIFIRVGSDR